MKIVSWNVNGLRAIMRKDFARIMAEIDAEIICLQETKTNTALPFVLDGYGEQWCFGRKPGYSGTLTLVKEKMDVASECERETIPQFLRDEGRLMLTDCREFFLLNVYFPNGGMGPARLAYKMKYYEEFLRAIKELEKEKPVMFCGDVNTAHQEIDLARPRENSKNTGFLPEERAWLDEVAGAGFVDIWRQLHPGEVGYSWWDYKTRARERNVGWRIDQFWCSERFLPRVASCEILSQYLGSDHAPVEVVVE